MKDRRTHIIAELEKNMKYSIVFFQSLSPNELGIQIYQDGAKWTVQQVLGHFVTIERTMQ